MKKTTKIISLALTTVFCVGLAGIVAGCNKNSNSDKTIMVVWCPEADHEFAKQVAADFQTAHPDKKYEFQFGIQGEGDAATKVLTDVENAPDVFSFASDQIIKLIVGDALAQIGGDRLTNMKAANTADSVDAATVTVGGVEKTYAFPYTDNTFFLYYDKSKLTETDVQTLDGILAKCDATHQFGYPMNDGWYNTAFFFGKGLDYEVTYNDSLGETAITTTFGNDEGDKVAESMFAYVNTAGFKADSDDSKLTAGFQDGSIIAGVSGVWNSTTIKEYLGDNFGVAKLPTYTYDKGGANEAQVQLKAFAGYKLLGVSKHSPNMVDALEFAEFYTNKQNQVLHFEKRGFLPTNKEAQQEDKVKADLCASAIAAQLQYSKTQKNVPSTLWTPMQGLGNAMINAKGGSFDAVAQLKGAVDNITK